MKNKHVSLKKKIVYISGPNSRNGILQWIGFTETLLGYGDIYEKQKIFERLIPKITEQFIGSVTIDIKEFIFLEEDHYKIRYVIHINYGSHIDKSWDESKFILKVNCEK